MQTHPTIAQPAGTVVPGSQVPVGFKYHGNEKAEGRLNKRRFEKKFATLARVAGYAGTFHIHLVNFVKGTAHTKGLRIRSPGRDRVEITWHEGSNDNCLLMYIAAFPPHLPPVQLHSRLKAAQAGKLALDQHEAEVVALPAGDKEGATGQRTDANDVGVHIPQLLGDEQLQQESARVEAVAVETCHMFMGDAELIAVCMLEIFGQVDEKGWIGAVKCAGILEAFGYSPRTADRILHSLVIAGHLISSGKDRQRFALRPTWLERFRPSEPEAKVEQPARPQAPASPPPVETVQPSEAGIAELAPAKIVSQTARFDQLSKLAKRAERARTRRGELAAEIAAHEELIRGYSARRDAVQKDLALLDGFLGQSDVKDAEAKFAQISALLNG